MWGSGSTNQIDAENLNRVEREAKVFTTANSSRSQAWDLSRGVNKGMMYFRVPIK